MSGLGIKYEHTSYTNRVDGVYGYTRRKVKITIAKDGSVEFSRPRKIDKTSHLLFLEYNRDPV